ncbi:MAG: hypothetical protein P4L59_00480 [Desulfosporosinus sp.]|nr:hypothetical protein [Desulfosporosinus sp.]
MMATTYERYLKLNLDGSRVGLERGESERNYFSTPKGAKVIGWAATFGGIMDVKELARKFLSIGILSGTMKSGISQRFTPAVKAWSWTFAYRFQLSASFPLWTSESSLLRMMEATLPMNSGCRST